MAIRFVDVEPEAEAGKSGTKAKAAKPATPPAAPASETAEDTVPALPLAKPDPKTRGRKKPPAAEATPSEVPGGSAESTSGDGLLPGLQLHAKPTPKPRGRKKAFG